MGTEWKGWGEEREKEKMCVRERECVTQMHTHTRTQTHMHTHTHTHARTDRQTDKHAQIMYIYMQTHQDMSDSATFGVMWCVSIIFYLVYNILHI